MLHNSKLRLDGRQMSQHRPLKIGFGPDKGCCVTSLGNTKVMAQISATVGEPRVTRPSEGILNLRVNTSMMGPDTVRDEEHVELSRLLTKNIKDSACLDLEALCIVGGEKVWHIMVDVIVLNHEGNVIEAASIATMAALHHHRRPDVTIEEGNLVFQNNKPQRFILNHLPFLMKFVFFKDSSFCCDPTENEEKFCDGYIVIGGNEFQEITCLHISGKSSISKDQTLKQCNYALKRTNEINVFMKRALDQEPSIFKTLARVY